MKWFIKADRAFSVGDKVKIKKDYTAWDVEQGELDTSKVYVIDDVDEENEYGIEVRIKELGTGKWIEEFMYFPEKDLIKA